MRKKLNKSKCIDDIKRLMPIGFTLQDIAFRHEVSRERVRQVLVEIGWKPDFPIGASARAARRRADLDASEIRRYGMTYKEKKAIKNDFLSRGLHDPIRRYSQQEGNAKKRGIEWKFTFGSWWEVWKGFFDKHGRGGGRLQMCRKGDEGAYGPENVYLATQSENMRDYWLKKKG